MSRPHFGAPAFLTAGLLVVGILLITACRNAGTTAPAAQNELSPEEMALLVNQARAAAQQEAPRIPERPADKPRTDQVDWIAMGPQSNQTTPHPSAADYDAAPKAQPSENQSQFVSFGATSPTRSSAPDRTAVPTNSKPAPRSSANPGEPAQSSAAPPPPAPPKPLTRQQAIDRLAELVGTADAPYDETLRPYIARAALSIFDPAREMTASDLADLPRRDQRLVLAYHRVFRQLGQTLGGHPRADREALEDAAAELADEIASWRTLEIRKLRLCKRVEGYGVYETFSRNTFLARKRQPVVVYTELDHFDSELSENNTFVTRLNSEIVLFNQSDGLPVWRQRPVTIVDESRNRRRDFFTVQIIELSELLTVGKYLLKVTITDEIGQSVDEATIPIEIVSDPSLVSQSQ
jgi:hypothetical protein